jgi:hypothetical protein
VPSRVRGAQAADRAVTDLRVSVRDAQISLGHARISTALEIYTDVDEQAKRDAQTQLHGLPDAGDS